MATLSITADINTCFALLFLRKSNFARDLTANLKNKPHQTTIRSGGEDAAVAIPPPAVKSSAAERLRTNCRMQRRSTRTPSSMNFERGRAASSPIRWLESFQG